MRLLHKHFSKDRTQVAVDCACGVMILHSIKLGWCVRCPNCDAEEDLETLARELLSRTSLEQTLEEIEHAEDVLKYE